MLRRRARRERQSEGTTPGWVRRLSGYVFRHRRDAVLAIVAAILGSSCQVVVPLLERQIVDGSIVHRTSPLWPWLAALLGLAAASFGFAYIRRYHGGRVALTVQYAKNLPGFRVNASDPGYTATEFNGFGGHQTVTEGTDATVALALLGADGPTGEFHDRSGRIEY